MTASNYSNLLLKSLYEPASTFADLATYSAGPVATFFRYSIWLLLLPPGFALAGAAGFGWRLGAAEPVMLDIQTLLLISGAYFLLLVFGLVSTALLGSWMASTYGADASPGKHVALITVVGEPLALASMAHLFPDVLVNVLVLIPVMIWSMYLLYKGVPVALGIPPERGMLMASSLVGWLLVAAVSLLGISMAMWTMGVGPLLGV